MIWSADFWPHMNSKVDFNTITKESLCRKRKELMNLLMMQKKSLNHKSLPKKSNLNPKQVKMTRRMIERQSSLMVTGLSLWMEKSLIKTHNLPHITKAKMTTRMFWLDLKLSPTREDLWNSRLELWMVHRSSLTKMTCRHVEMLSSSTWLKEA